jgi:glycosyltransferase involved in cell wall biosynthesis
VPSVTAENGDSEGLPTILLEAQAIGVPVVATRHSGIPEGVEEGVTAELVAEKDSNGMAAMLKSFLESPAKAQSYARAGRRFVEGNFDLRKQMERLEELYDDLRVRYRAG